MKIACQSCQAKYTIADEKVVGKIVKIRCKKCGATIVINGNDPEATSPLPAGETGSEWTVNVAEGDQRTMTTEEIVDAYASGVVTDDTFCWKDGMADWLPLREIEELSGLVGGGSGETAVAQQPAGGADFAPLSVRGFDDQATVPVQRENMGGLFGGGSNGHAESNGNGASLFSGGAPAPAPSAPAQAAPAAARRAGGRAGGADLFGGAAAAGGEEDVMTSAPNGAPPPAAADDGKLTGQRNENSVLFSLSALTSNSPKVEKEKPSADGSGLIDIRALSSTMAADQNKKKEHVDDIMNLGGGGAFSAALTAPILAPPIASADLGSSDVGGEKSNNKKLMAIIAVGFGLLLLVIIFLVVKLASGPKVDDTTATNPTGTATGTGTAPTAAPTDTAAAAGTGTAAAGSTAAGANTGTGATPPGTGAVAANNPPTTSHGGGGGGGGGSSHASSGGGGGGSPAATHDTTPTPPSGGGGGGGGGLLGAMDSAAGVKPSGGGGGGASASGGMAPFDRGAAAATLGSISSSLGSCKKGDNPSGAGHVKVTFAPNGTVKAVDVDQPPYAGTSVGGCVAGKFRAAHVPPFAGSEISVGKSFNL